MKGIRYLVKRRVNKTRTSKVGAISKAQKAQNIFWEKNFSAKIFEKGPFLISKHAFCCKITKHSKGGPFGDTKKFSKKSRTVPKKIKRGHPLASAGFVGYV